MLVLSSLQIIRSETQRYLSTSQNKELNKNKCISINNEWKAKLNLTYCTYLEFVHSYCDEIIRINEKVYHNNGLYKSFSNNL